MKLIVKSKKLPITNSQNNDPVFLFNQFFIPKTKQRYEEIKFCLKKNVENSNIDTIYLLGERIYTTDELGIKSDKIIQKNIKKRLTFKDVFSFVRRNNMKGYMIFVNSDIFFLNETIKNIKKSTFHCEKLFGALLRYEYNNKDISKSKIFGPRFDSQDTWILHSNYLIPLFAENAFDFEFGKPGCDNKLIYLMNILGYEIVNDPKNIQTLHFHKEQGRSYTIRDAIQEPWGVVVPHSFEINTMPNCLGINLQQFDVWSNKFTTLMMDDNERLFDYIQTKLGNNQNFIIPRVSGIENNTAVFQHVINENSHPETGPLKQYIERTLYAMKNNAGIQLDNKNTITYYSNHYLSAFNLCDMYGSWEPQGNYVGHIAQSQAYMLNKYTDKQPFWALTFDIFHYIFSTPWTQSLRGKRILIISPFVETIKEQLPIREHIYQGVDLFPDCKFVFLKPPQTQADEPSKSFLHEFDKFKQNVDEMLNLFDVALVSCGGYANPICAHIFLKGKSAIYVGGVLQMYFGILGNRWIKERPDILKLYHNQYWKRPKESEKPKNCSKVEGACYW